ncbi:MAG TPA: dockerin type I repeat-containing protein [Tepidisphaeraceae bacterium]|jgi:hypothetical protein
MLRASLCVAASWLFAASAGASVLASYNFNRLNASPSTVVENLTVSSITRHDGESVAYFAYPTNGSDSYLASYQWNGGDYYSFQVTVPTGGNISLASISFNGDSNLPSGVAMSTDIEYSTSSTFTNPKTMGSFQVAGPFTSPFALYTASSNPLLGGGGTYYFRIDNSAPNIQYPSSYGLYLDNIQLNGTLTPTWLGDTNLDGSVDNTDLQTLVKNSGKSVSGGYADGDLNGDGIVNSDDFGLFFYGLAEFNDPLLPAPEPAASLILGASILAVSLRRNRSGFVK